MGGLTNLKGALGFSVVFRMPMISCAAVMHRARLKSLEWAGRLCLSILSQAALWRLMTAACRFKLWRTANNSRL